MYPGKLVKLELQPDFGWLSILIAPFLPKIYFWFESASMFRRFTSCGGLREKIGSSERTRVAPVISTGEVEKP
jgi:hypothetical protein